MRKKDKNIFYSLEDELEIKIKRKSTLSDWFENFKLYSNPYAHYVQYNWADSIQAINVEQPQQFTTDDGYYYTNRAYTATLSNSGPYVNYTAQPVYYTTDTTRTYHGN